MFWGIANVICESTFHTMEIPSDSYCLTLKLKNFKPRKYNLFPSPQGLGRLWGAWFDPGPQICDLTVFHVPPTTAFSDNTISFSLLGSSIFSWAFSSNIPQDSTLSPLFFLYTIILAWSSALWPLPPWRRMRSPHLQPWNTSTLVPVMGWHIRCMIITLFINLQAQF